MEKTLETLRNDFGGLRAGRAHASLLDNIMVGQVGTNQMSGVAIANQLIFVYNLCIFGGMSGAGIFGAQFYGQGNEAGLRYVFRFKLAVGFKLQDWRIKRQG